MGLCVCLSRHPAPSGPVTGLNINKPGDNKVIVRWTPPEYVLGYTVFLNGVTNQNISDPSATDATLTELRAGVEHMITVQADGDLPGPLSDPVSVTLAGVIK